MALSYLGKCANCETEAILKCAGCIGAPEYQPVDSTNVSYCGRVCQKKHWPSHKPRCKTMRQRRKLLRAALVFKKAFLTYREVIYDIQLTKIEFQDGVLHLHQKQRHIAAPCIRGPFPDHLTTNAEHREAALAFNQCTAAMSLLGRLVQKLLAGNINEHPQCIHLGNAVLTHLTDVTSTIELLDLRLERRITPAKLVPGPDATSCLHTVLKVRRSSANETWIIDATGCQYGFRDVLVPFDRYIAERECRSLAEPVPYNATETKDLDYFTTLPFMNRTPALVENMKQERQSRLHFAEFVKTGVSQDLLDGSNSDFKDKLDRFVSKLTLHMLDPSSKR